MKELCEVCKTKTAHWCYMPAKVDSDSLYCDDCIDTFRGCSCNISSVKDYEDDLKEIEDDFVIYYKLDFKTEEFIPTTKDQATDFEFLDENKKRFPCVEYDYDEEGWDFDEE